MASRVGKYFTKKWPAPKLWCALSLLILIHLKRQKIGFQYFFNLYGIYIFFFFLYKYPISCKLIISVCPAARRFVACLSAPGVGTKRRVWCGADAAMRRGRGRALLLLAHKWNVAPLTYFRQHTSAPAATSNYFVLSLLGGQRPCFALSRHTLLLSDFGHFCWWKTKLMSTSSVVRRGLHSTPWD